MSQREEDCPGMGNCEAGVDCHQLFLYSEVTKVILDDAFPQPG